MVNITHKTSTLRQAIASAVVTVSKQETIDAIQNKKVPKGDIFEFSRAAGLLAIKKTSDVIPDCHPLPVEYASIKHELDELKITITVEVHSIYKTGVEVEAMHGAAITALTIYDMLKPIDKGVEISTIRLENKKGGKTDFKDQVTSNLKTAVIVCSDGVFHGKKKDSSGQKIIEKLGKINMSADFHKIIPDEFNLIQDTVKKLSEEEYNLVLITGGTGLSPSDVTPDAIRPLIDREIPGNHGSSPQLWPAANTLCYAVERYSRLYQKYIGDYFTRIYPGCGRKYGCVVSLYPACVQGGRRNEA